MLQEILLAVFTLIFLVFYLHQRPKLFPRGPFSWPLVGNLLSLGYEPYKTLMDLRKVYGDIIAVDFGSLRGIVLNETKLIKEAYNLPTFSGRPSHLYYLMHPDTGEKRGVLMTEGAPWAEQRRFVLKNLRDFGFGKKSMETMIQEEVSELIENFKKTTGKPISTHMRFNVPVVNALWRIVTEERYPHDDPKINILIANIEKIVTSVKFSTILTFFPWAGKISSKYSGLDEVKGNFHPIYSFIQESIDYHQETYEEGTKRDLMDCYIQEIRKADSSSSFFKQSGEENMLSGIFDLFLAGTEATSGALTWAFYLLAHFPKSQEKLHEAITEVVGTSRLPSLTDRQNIPFAEAVIMEVMRYGALAPMGGFHTALEDVDFHGFKIPKGTTIISNIFGVLHDPEIWGDPENFRPERFLSSDEKTILRNEAWIPFSVGRRVCLGESLVKDELFLFTTSLFQRFKIEFDQSSPMPELGHSMQSSILLPKAHNIVMHDIYQS